MATDPTTGEHIPGSKRDLFLGLAGLVVLAALFLPGLVLNKHAQPTTKPTTVATPTQADSPEADLRDALANVDADDVSVLSYGGADAGTIATVGFTATPGADNYETRLGIIKATYAIAKAALDSKVPFDELDLVGTQGSDATVYTASFTHDELAGINYAKPALSSDAVAGHAIKGSYMLDDSLRDQKPTPSPSPSESEDDSSDN